MKLYISETQLNNILDKLLLENDKKFRELTVKEENNAYAAFVLVKLPNGKIAATTRPYEKGKNKKIGLPGGKVEKNETPKQAAFRECKEEGWDIPKVGKIIASKMIDGNPIVWFEAESATKLEDYKEKKEGIKAIEVSIDRIANSGYGNSFIKELFNNETEIKEDDTASTSSSSTSTSSSSTTSGGAQGYPQVGKWESGVTRGPGNQLGVTKWSDVVGVSLKRGKANPLK